MTLSAVLVRRKNDTKLPDWVANITDQTGSRYKEIIKFTKLSPRRKLLASQLLAECPLRIFVVASNKKNMRRYKNPRAEKMNSPQWFYNWLVRILVERITDYCLRYANKHKLTRRHVKFIFSQSGGHSYSQTAAYQELIKNQSRNKSLILTKWEVMHWSLVEAFPHYRKAGLQLADVAASAMYHAVDNLDTGPCVPDYAMAMEKVIARNKHGFQRDFGVVLQPTPDWSVDITDDQKTIFKHYGYSFIK